jgi:4-diphosphocytidyl-2-C-methyl-D-erythritol kinase
MIGSDVPFFLMLKPCYAYGRGETMKLLKDFRINSDILIVNPNLHISTKWAFEKLSFKRDVEKKSRLDKVIKFDKANTGMFENDFEDIVFRKYAEMKVIKDELIQMGAMYSSMSGTGATMFGLFEKDRREDLMKSRENYKHKGYFTYISD